MARNKLKESVNSLTPKELFEKYKDNLTNEQYMFVNLIVIQNVSAEDALVLAYPKTAKWTAISRRVRAYNLLNKYLNPFVYQYYNDLMEAVKAEYREQLSWSKERAQKELIGIVDMVNEESKPIVTPEGEYIVPRVSKPRMDAKIQAIQELNKITGITKDTELNLNVPVIFTNEDKLVDGKPEESKNGEGDQADG